MFKAVVNSQEALSYLGADIGGVCDNVRTLEASQRCGLAQYLMATCFQDREILGEDNRGVDISENSYWTDDPKLMDAQNYCQTLTTLNCLAKPKRACISYLRAASLADFDILFTKKQRYEGAMNAFTLGEKLDYEFGQNYEKFIEEYGYAWFFCKCKEESRIDCLLMTSNSS